VVLSTLYLVMVLSFVFIEWPTPERTAHRDEFITRMPEAARKHVLVAYSSEYEAGKHGTFEGERRHSFPNGAVLVLGGRTDPRLAAVRAKYHEYDDLSDVQLAKALRSKRPAEYGDLVVDSFIADDDVEKVVNAYTTVVFQAAHAARWSFTARAFLAWFVPCLVLYALGWSVAWIREGFL
jgi:hypothetical protein